MKEGTERVQHEENYAPKPEVRKSAEIHYINDFAAYSALSGGHLLREEFDRTKAAAENSDVTINTNFSRNANFIAGEADIILSDKSLKLYSILRSDTEISSDLLHSDQPILAEALRMEGRADDAQKLIAAYPVITF